MAIEYQSESSTRARLPAVASSNSFNGLDESRAERI